VSGAGAAQARFPARNALPRRPVETEVAPPRHPPGAGRREILAAAVGLSLLALVLSAGHIRNGGFYYDDWSVLALARFPPAGGLLHGLWLYYGQRPAQVLYYAALDELLGAHAAPRLALAAAMVALQATLLYALLRRVALRARDALACAALSLSFPFSDSVWLWGILSLTSLSIAAALLGVILALRALERRGARWLALHGASLALFVVSVLSYEVFALAGCLAGLLYVRAVGFARARYRWALDVVVILATVVLARGILPIDIATPSRTQSLAGALGHAWLIAMAGARVAGAALLPFGSVTAWVGAVLLAAGIGSACALRASLPEGARARAELGRWLVIAAAGVVIAAAGWAVYVPAPDHYSPSAPGTVNRVNALAAVGLALLAYSFLMLLGCFVARLLRLPASAAAAIAVTLAIVLCGAYVKRTADDARAWDTAARDQRAELSDLHAALPVPPRGSVIYAYDAPLRVGPGVPVLNTTLDLSSAVRMSYASPTLGAVPLVAAVALRCGSQGPTGGGVLATYGRSYLLDLRARRAAALTGRARCVSAIARASLGASPAEAG
jgi:hypothetical protein